MIFSRTASTNDVVDLGIRDNLLNYLRSPVSLTRYNIPLTRFWEYSLLLKYIEYYDLRHSSVLSLNDTGIDLILDDISISNKLNLTQSTVDQFMKMLIKSNKYDILCSFGTSGYGSFRYKILDKMHKHLSMNGTLIITTEENKLSLTKDDLITISFFLENLGYEFCSSELEQVKYADNSNIHSLVMRRINN